MISIHDLCVVLVYTYCLPPDTDTTHHKHAVARKKIKLNINSDRPGLQDYFYQREDYGPG
jgi:hypothetical protein